MLIVFGFFTVNWQELRPNTCQLISMVLRTMKPFVYELLFILRQWRAYIRVPFRWNVWVIEIEYSWYVDRSKEQSIYDGLQSIYDRYALISPEFYFPFIDNNFSEFNISCLFVTFYTNYIYFLHVFIIYKLFFLSSIIK